MIFRHYPAGELRDIRIAQKLKAMGVLPGSAGLWSSSGGIIREDQEGSHFELRVLFLELKLPGRKCSEAQMVFALAAKLLGAEYEVATSVDEAIALLGERGLIKSGIEVCGKRW